MHVTFTMNYYVYIVDSACKLLLEYLSFKFCGMFSPLSNQIRPSQ